MKYAPVIKVQSLSVVASSMRCVIHGDDFNVLSRRSSL